MIQPLVFFFDIYNGKKNLSPKSDFLYNSKVLLTLLSQFIHFLNLLLNTCFSIHLKRTWRLTFMFLCRKC